MVAEKIYEPWLCNAPISSQIWQGDLLVLDSNGCARIAKTIEEYNEFGIGAAIETSTEGQKYIHFVQETTVINVGILSVIPNYIKREEGDC